MVISLSKGGNVSLTKEAGAAGLFRVQAGLGWQERTTTGAAYDLDASALLVGANGKVLSDGHFVFYGNLDSPDGSVHHQGDELTGGDDGDGDEETIDIDLSQMAPEVERIVMPVSIYDAEARGNQNFGQVTNAYIRIINADNNVELARYDLSEDASSETAMIFGELYRNAGEWKFRAVGQGYASGLAGIARDYGVNIG